MVTQYHANYQPTILWHDFETFGISPKYDKPSQFAAIRTDLELNIIGEPEVFYCKPPADYLPHPEACLVTGITPQKALEEGLTEAQFCARIQALFTEPNTCVAGYNSIRFDDEVSRYLFYRNFYDAYAREWQNGNSRWDIIDMVRACYALRPEGINWPIVKNEDGSERVSFRLELLTAENGISHEAAHDAMSDVYATIEMAKLIKQKQPKLYDFLFNLRSKREVADLIDIYNMKPVVHTSGKISSKQGSTSWFAPVAMHPSNKNAVIAVDLAQSPEPLLTLEKEQIKERLYTKRSELAESEHPIPLKLIHLNKCPVVAPAKTLTEENAARLSIPREQCLINLKQLQENAALIREKVGFVFTENYGDRAPDDAEHALYSGGFFGDADKQQMELIVQMAENSPEQLGTYPFSFVDSRLNTLLFRFRARNFPDTLTEPEQQQWQQYCQEKLQCNSHGLTAQEYLAKIQNLAMENEKNEAKLKILAALEEYLTQDNTQDNAQAQRPKKKQVKNPNFNFEQQLSQLTAKKAGEGANTDVLAELQASLASQNDPKS